MESSGSSRRQGVKDVARDPIGLEAFTPSLISSSSSSRSFSSLTQSTVDVNIFFDPEVLVFCDDPHTTGPRKLALKLYNPNDFHIRFEIKSTNSERYTVSEPTGTIQDKSYKELIVSLIPFARQHRSSERSTSPSGARPSRQSSVESSITSSALIEEVTSDRFRVIVAPRGVLQERAQLSSRDVSLLVCHTLAAFKRLSASSTKFPMVSPPGSTLTLIPSESESAIPPSIPRQFPHASTCPLASSSSSSSLTSSRVERCTCSVAHASYSPHAQPANATQSPEVVPPAAVAAPSPVLRAGLLWPALAACCLFALFVPVAEIEELQRQVALLAAQEKTGTPQAAAAGAAEGFGGAASGMRAALSSLMNALHLPPPDWLLVIFESLDALLVSLPALWHACALRVAAKCAASFVLGAAAAIYFNRFFLVAWRT